MNTDNTSSNKVVSAIRGLVKDIRDRSSIFVTNGPRMLTPQEKTERKQQINERADRFDKLAEDEELGGSVDRQQVDSIYTELRNLGFYPDAKLASELAYALVNRDASRKNSGRDT